MAVASFYLEGTDGSDSTGISPRPGKCPYFKEVHGIIGNQGGVVLHGVNGDRSAIGRIVVSLGVLRNIRQLV